MTLYFWLKETIDFLMMETKFLSINVELDGEEFTLLEDKKPDLETTDLPIKKPQPNGVALMFRFFLLNVLACRCV